MAKIVNILFLSLLLFSGGLYASGGSGGTGGDGGTGGGGGGDATSNYYQNQYDLGKRVMETQVLCEGCPLFGTKLDNSGVQLITKQLKKKGELAKVLSKKERKAAKYFLKKRFL